MICYTIKNRCNFFTSYITFRLNATIRISIDITNVCRMLIAKNIFSVLSCFINSGATATTATSTANGYGCFCGNRIFVFANLTINVIRAVFVISYATSRTFFFAGCFSTSTKIYSFYSCRLC